MAMVAVFPGVIADAPTFGAGASPKPEEDAAPYWEGGTAPAPKLVSAFDDMYGVVDPGGISAVGGGGPTGPGPGGVGSNMPGRTCMTTVRSIGISGGGGEAGAA